MHAQTVSRVVEKGQQAATNTLISCYSGNTGDPERVRGRKYHQPYPNTLDPPAAAPVVDWPG
jgi:hypothetical protein